MSPPPSPGLDVLKSDLSEEDAVSMDDERRSLPKDWVRCFDINRKQHFYVDETTSRASWLHPYDDPEFLRTLDDSDPANPSSIQAENARKRAEDESLALSKLQGGAAAAEGPKKSFFQKRKDELFNGGSSGKKKLQELEDRQRAIKAAEGEYLERKESLAERKTALDSIKKLYAPDPYKYPAPSEAFSRYTNNVVGYGYPGGYQRKYTPQYGYGITSSNDSFFDRALGSILAANGAPVPASAKTNYGFGG